MHVLLYVAPFPASPLYFALALIKRDNAFLSWHRQSPALVLEFAAGKRVSCPPPPLAATATDATYRNAKGHFSSLRVQRIDGSILAGS